MLSLGKEKQEPKGWIGQDPLVIDDMSSNLNTDSASEAGPVAAPSQPEQDKIGGADTQPAQSKLLEKMLAADQRDDERERGVS